MLAVRFLSDDYSLNQFIDRRNSLVGFGKLSPMDEKGRQKQ
jgi:hypothetical protein